MFVEVVFSQYFRLLIVFFNMKKKNILRFYPKSRLSFNFLSLVSTVCHFNFFKMEGTDPAHDFCFVATAVTVHPIN